MPASEVLPREVLDLSLQPGGVRAEYQPNPGAASVVPLLRGKYRGSHAWTFSQISTI